MGNVSPHSLTERFGRQILLPQWGQEGQVTLSSKKALIVGLGGLGTHVAESLLRMGLRNLTIIDFDEVHLTNLHRQYLYSEVDIGQKKVFAAQRRLQEIDVDAKIIPLAKRVAEIDLAKLVANNDLIFECTDSFDAAFLLHHHAWVEQKIFVQAKLFQWEFQTLAFDFSLPDSSCLRCLYESPPEDGCVEVCSQAGIAPPIAAMAGQAQALLGIQIVLGKWEKKTNRIFTFDGLSFETQRIKIPKNPNCPLCSLPYSEARHSPKPSRELTWREFFDSDRSDLVVISDQSSLKIAEVCKKFNKNFTLVSPGFAELKLADNSTIVCDHGYRSLELVLKNRNLQGLASISGGIENIPTDL